MNVGALSLSALSLSKTIALGLPVSWSDELLSELMIFSI